MTPYCHGPMRPTLVDAAYGHVLWTCRQCGSEVREGPSEHDIWQRETPRPFEARTRTPDEQFASGWRGL